MKIRLGLISWATGALVLVAVSACGDSDADPPPTSPSLVVVTELADDERVADIAVGRGDRRCDRGDPELLHGGRRTPQRSGGRPQAAEDRRDEHAAQRRRDPGPPPA